MKILIQGDYDGNNLKTLYGIVDYKQDNSAVPKANAFVTTNRGVRNMRQTTIGWKLIIQWKYCTTTWMLLKVLKEFIPVEVEEFVFARVIFRLTRILMVGANVVHTYGHKNTKTVT